MLGLRSSRRVLAVLVATAGLAPVAAAVVTSPAAQAADVVYEVHHIPTVGGATIRIEIQRDTSFDAAKQPVLLTYTPYGTLSEPEPANDLLADRYVPKGFARAVADVLGTRGSTGCWDYGGADEQQSGVDVVKYLAGLEWSNGKVGMAGVSYDGTTATMVAARGDDVPELKAIVPVAAISRWYGYAYADGVRWNLNSEHPYDEGVDTPLLFDAGFGRTVPVLPDGDPAAPAIARTGECGAVEHTERGYDRSPDYDAFWLERDYRKDAAKFRAATFVVHGWQDFNVKQDEGLSLYEALPVDDPATEAVEGVPFKRLWLTQAPHADGEGPGYEEMLDAFLAQTLQGVDGGFAPGSTGVTSLGRDADGESEWRTDADWPPAGTSAATLHLGRRFDHAVPGVPTGETGELSTEPQDDGFWTWVDSGAISEEVSVNDPLNEDGHGYYSLFYKSGPLTADARLAGAATLETWVRTPGAGATLTPVLVEVEPDGTLRPVERGFLNLDYRNGLSAAAPTPAGRWVKGTVRFLPQDYTFREGSRIGLLLQSSNTMWAFPGNPGVFEVANGENLGATPGGTRLHLPLQGPLPL